MNPQWNTTLGGLCLRIVILLFWGLALIQIGRLGGCDNPRDRDPSGIHTKTVE